MTDQHSGPLTVLVTGGGGFVGRQLVPALQSEGHRVRVLDLFLFAAPYKQHREIETVVGDIRDDAAVRGALEAVDAVIHLAAMSNDPSGDLDPVITREINRTATLRVADMARHAGVQRFINVSSASVYGVRQEPDVTEDLAPRPQTLYARYKAETEAAILASNGEGWLTASVRPATLSGLSPRMRLDLTVNILTWHAVQNSVIRVFGGNQYRPNLSVHDMVAALTSLLVADPDVIGGRTFNLVESNHTVREIAERIVGIVGEHVRIETTPTDDTRSYRLSGALAVRALSFRPSRTLDDSIREVAGALRSGEVVDPVHIVHRNVDYLQAHPLESMNSHPL